MLSISDFKFLGETRFEQEEQAIVDFKVSNGFEFDVINVKLSATVGNDIAILEGPRDIPALDAGATEDIRLVIESDQAAEIGPREIRIDADFVVSGEGSAEGVFQYELAPD